MERQAEDAQAASVGSQFMGNRSGIHFQHSDLDLAEGPEANGVTEEQFLKIFPAFYRRIMTHECTKSLFLDDGVDAEEHGRRLGLMLLTRLNGDDIRYRRERPAGSGGMFSMLYASHEKSKRSTNRPQHLRGRGFTLRQVQTWLGCMYFACKEVGIPSSFHKAFLHFLGSTVGFYGPFVQE